MAADLLTLDLAPFIRDIPDFPKPGIVFKDVTPLLADPGALAATVERLAAPHRGEGVTKVVGMEARGFLLGTPVALALGAGFVPVRKAGKLPGDIHEVSYSLEYGEEVLQMQRDAVESGERVLVVDDVLATGGTVAATRRLVEDCGGEVAAVAVLMELSFLPGRDGVGDTPLTALHTV